MALTADEAATLARILREAVTEGMKDAKAEEEGKEPGARVDETAARARYRTKETEGEISAELEKQIRLIREQQKEHLSWLDKRKEQFKSWLSDSSKIIEKLEKIKEAQETIGRDLDHNRHLSEIELKVLDQKVAATKRQLELEGDPEKRKALQEDLQLYGKQQKGFAIATKSTKDMGKSFETMFKNLKAEGGLKGMLDVESIASGFGNFNSLLKTGSQGLMTFAQNAWAAAGPAAMGALLNAIKDLTFKLVDLENGFRRATGASAEMARGVTRTYEATRQYGVSAEGAEKANLALYRSYADFTMQTKETRDEIAATGAVLEMYGVSNETYAKSIRNTTKMFGTAALEADDVMRGIAAHAQALQVPVDQLAGQYESMTPKLAKLGAAGEKAFKDLARTSKLTNLEMGKLLQVTDKFDTFEGAATQAGKLNAALGGNFVNAMDLMMAADPNERFMMIRDSIHDAGLSFESMSYYQRQFYAETLGLADAGELALMMSGNMDLLDSSIQMTTDDYVDMAEQAAAFQTIQQKINTVIANLIPIVEPAIDGLNSFMNMIVKNAEEIRILIGVLLVVVGVVGAVIAGFTGFGAVSGILLALVGLFIMFPDLLKPVWTFFETYFSEIWLALKEIWAPISAIFDRISLGFDLLLKKNPEFKKFVDALFDMSEGFSVAAALAKMMVFPITSFLRIIATLLNFLLLVVDVFYLFATLFGDASAAPTEFATAIEKNLEGSLFSFIKTIWGIIEPIAYLASTAADLMGTLAGWYVPKGLIEFVQTFTKLANAAEKASDILPFLTKTWEELSFEMFERDVGHSAFSQALGYISENFGLISKIVLTLMNPIAALTLAWSELGKVLFSGGAGRPGGILSGISDLLGAFDLSSILPSPDIFNGIATAIERIAAAINKIPSGKTISLVTAMKAMEIVSDINTETIAKTTTGAAATTGAILNNVTAVTKASQVVVNNNTAANQQNAQQMQVVINLTDWEVGEFFKNGAISALGTLTRKSLLGA